MKTVVLGASPNPERYSYRAVKMLRKYNHEVVAIGKKKGTIEDVPIINEAITLEGVHTVAMYLSPVNQKEYYNYILTLKPKRIIFNPGTENEELQKLAEENNIEVVEWCVLIMLSSNKY